MEKINIKKVAIIGAGPSGVVVAKHLSCNNQFEIVIFERQNSVGGLWIYNEHEMKDRNDVNAKPLYRDMRTNLPKQVMCYPDFAFPEEIPSFPCYTAVQKYIECYAKTFNVIDLIRFKTEVLNVVPLKTNSDSRFVKWNIESRNIDTDVNNIEEFDAVVLCSGIFSTPLIPSIDGIENFKGDILHSKWYNGSHEYENKTVVLIGFGSSAADIVVGLSKVCHKIYMSRHEERFFGGNHPSNVKRVSTIKSIDTNGHVLLENDTKITADVLLFCTGYKYDFPYLSSECQVNIEENGKLVMPLYKHVFNINYPSMAIVTLLQGGPVFSIMHHQSAYVAKVFSGEVSLPSQRVMLEETNKTLNSLEPDQRKHFHRIKFNHFQYIDELALIAGNKKNPEIIKKIYMSNYNERLNDMYNYKRNEYQVFDLNNFIVVQYNN